MKIYQAKIYDKKQPILAAAYTGKSFLTSSAIILRYFPVYIANIFPLIYMGGITGK